MEEIDQNNQNNQNNLNSTNDYLNVIIVQSNPSGFKRRTQLSKEFIERMKHQEKVKLYIVELCYKDQEFEITDSHNDQHLQLRGYTELWHKENMINLGIKKLLPENWTNVAWIDADIEFENSHWVDDTLKILNGTYDIVQLFSIANDMEYDKTTIKLVQSAGSRHARGLSYCSLANKYDYSHPGYAWAITKNAYNKINGLIDVGILGSGDFLMTISLLNEIEYKLNKEFSSGYRQKVLDFQEKAKCLKFGFVPGVIHHYFHGTKANRQYADRWKVLVKYAYDPHIHLTIDDQGLYIPTDQCPSEFLKEIKTYFDMRKEDEIGS